MTEEQEGLFLNHLTDMYRLLFAGKIVSNPTWFARSCRIEMEDLQQIAAIGLIKAAERFNPHRGIKFTTFAIHVIKYQLLNYRRNLIRRNIDTIPLESFITMDGGAQIPLLDSIPDPHSTETQAEANLLLESLPEQTREMLLLHIHGFSQKEIGEIFGISQVHVSRKLSGKLLNDDDLEAAAR